ncbi:hypothetical protein [Trinickia diaoshuihuensis]|jgi:myosin heavy subunit|uniref:hypothetical protein n=1 Tax=Trinickia diaoshuihuensis TaxID=2292265 RepID=UPI000E22289A|nr:hypothetical protein [Trinickia diaoshuihuensis]
MKSVRQIAIAAQVAAALLLTTAGAHAQSMEDKLRGQLRLTIMQLRQLQDNQTQLQADKTAAEQQRDSALAQVKALQAQLAAAQGSSGALAAADRALAQEKAGHAQDAQQLVKYKAAYEALQSSAKAAETQRAQLASAATQRDAQLQACEAKNADLYRIGHEILDAYEHVGWGAIFSSREPFAQKARVKYDQIGQRYGDRLYAGKFDPSAQPAQSASGAVAADAASGAQP